MHPRVGFIGCEPFVNGMAKALAAIAARKLSNVRLSGRRDRRDRVAAAGVARRRRPDYPVPWPKRRHWERRFVQAARVAELARLLRPGGEFRFVTDVPDYAAWCSSAASARWIPSGARNAHTTGAGRGPALRPPATKPRRCAKAACPVTCDLGGDHRLRACRLKLP